MNARLSLVEEVGGSQSRLKLQEEIQHPRFEYRTSYRRCIELQVQVRLLSKFLTGEIPAYPPFSVTTPLGLKTQGLLRKPRSPEGSVRAENP